MFLAFKVMNSKTENHPDILKQPFGGENYEAQRNVLDKALHYFETTSYIPLQTKTSSKISKKSTKKSKQPKPPKPRKIKFQRAGMITIKAIIQLQLTLRIDYGVPYLKTWHCSQDKLESKFSELRDVKSPNRTPNAKEFLLRLGRDISTNLLKDSSYDFISKRPEFDIDTNEEDIEDTNENSVDTDFPTFSPVENSRAFTLAGQLAFKLRNHFPYLVANPDEYTSEGILV